ncbi:MAG: imidazole glycerol phosphate synthase subunit HisH, partial [Clostridia bacterium]|nr:imidazole glycerol phosphate synthase subunit HisH [Clostridia bacterium]
NNKEELLKADKIILPGVGAFGDASIKLRESGLVDFIKELARDGKPIMGICLGMQLLFEKGFEHGEYEGLGLLKGEISPIADVIGEGLSIPHIGWNPLIIKKETPLLKYVKKGECVYFVHSYYAKGCDESLIATAEYGCELTAAVCKDNVCGCQFHPEKSGKTGLNILKAFSEML